MTLPIREMVLSDHDRVVELWRNTRGFIVRPLTDSRDGIARLLARNPGLSVVACRDELTRLSRDL